MKGYLRVANQSNQINNFINVSGRSNLHIRKLIGTPSYQRIKSFFIIIYHLFIYLFTDLFKERACPQLAKANLGGPCLNKQITKKYTDKN